MSPLYWATWSFYRLWLATYFRWRVYHPERVPLRGGVILASNHCSVLDPPLIGSGLHRPVNYLARETLFSHPIAGWALRQANAVPVDRDGAGAAGLRAILRRLREGGAILLFPEGTRSDDGSLQPARAGVGLVIVRTDVPVIPIRVFNTHRAWHRSTRIPRPCAVAITYGNPMDFSGLRAEAKSCSKEQLKELYQEASDRVMRAIAALQPGEDISRFPRH